MRKRALMPLVIASLLVAGSLFMDPAGANGARQSTRRTATATRSAPAAATLATSRQRDSIVRLYTAYFLRSPDASGLLHWSTAYATGGSLARISDFFAASSEFKNRYGSLSNAQFINLIYDNVFYRVADGPGAAYWTSVLDGGRSRGTVMMGFSESPEFVKLTATLPPA